MYGRTSAGRLKLGFAWSLTVLMGCDIDDDG